MPLAGWQPTRDTIQRYCQVIGKIRSAFSYRRKHWWHVDLRPDVTGLCTPPIPAKEGADAFLFKMHLDLMSHCMVLTSSKGQEHSIQLGGQSVAAFATEVLASLTGMGLEPKVDLEMFDDQSTGEYDAGAVERYWQNLGQIATVFDEFRSGLRQETSPISFWPHHFDMTFIWFSGRLVPNFNPADEEGADEQMSFGFSTGDEGLRDPYFYISAYPMPEALPRAVLPDGVTWYEESWQGALLQFGDLLTSDNPRGQLLQYLGTMFRAGEKLMAAN